MKWASPHLSLLATWPHTGTQPDRSLQGVPDEGQCAPSRPEVPAHISLKLGTGILECPLSSSLFVSNGSRFHPWQRRLLQPCLGGEGVRDGGPTTSQNLLILSQHMEAQSDQLSWLFEDTALQPGSSQAPWDTLVTLVQSLSTSW